MGIQKVALELIGQMAYGIDLMVQNKTQQEVV